MTPKQVRIADIRYFCSGGVPFSAVDWPSDVQALYAFSESVHAIGTRIACKLRELGFTISGYDHVYIVFTPVLRPNAVRESAVAPEAWQRYFAIGADPGHVAVLDEAGRDALAAEATLRVLRRVTGSDAGKLAMLKQVGVQLARDGADIEILHRASTFKALEVRIRYRIHAGGAGSAWIELEERASGRKACRPFVDLDSHSDLYALVDRLALAKGILTMHPRTSASARLVARRYRTPMQIDVEALLAGNSIAHYSSRPTRRQA